MDKKKWKLLSRKVVYDGKPHIKISKDKIQLPSGDIIPDYHRIETKDAVMLLVENVERKLLVYQEYRHGLNDFTYSFPAGGINKNEGFLEASKRELFEETGYVSNNFNLLYKYTVSGTYLVSKIYYVNVSNIKKKSLPSQKDMENPDHFWLKKEEIINAIRTEKFKCLTYATAALLWIFNKY